MKCLTILPHSNVIITENLDMYEVIIEIDDGEISDNFYLIKLPAKASIDFKKYYGDSQDNSLANWTNKTCPWYEDTDGKLIWDY